MNAIVLIFIVLASMFIASSANNLLTVATALDEYFELADVNMYRCEDWDKIYAFFAEKMPLLEEAYWEYRDLIRERLKE